MTEPVQDNCCCGTKNYLIVAIHGLPFPYLVDTKQSLNVNIVHIFCSDIHSNLLLTLKDKL